jgi:hypothetical protein
MTQHRWLCDGCGREWLANWGASGVVPWLPESGCPGCGGAAVRHLSYQPEFPGADIPRDGRPLRALAPLEVPPGAVQPPPLALLLGAEEGK